MSLRKNSANADHHASPSDQNRGAFNFPFSASTSCFPAFDRRRDEIHLIARVNRRIKCGECPCRSAPKERFTGWLNYLETQAGTRLEILNKFQFTSQIEMNDLLSESKARSATSGVDVTFN